MALREFIVNTFIDCAPFSRIYARSNRGNLVGNQNIPNVSYEYDPVQKIVTSNTDMSRLYEKHSKYQKVVQSLVEAILWGVAIESSFVNYNGAMALAVSFIFLSKILDMGIYQRCIAHDEFGQREKLIKMYGKVRNHFIRSDEKAISKFD